MNSQRTYRTTLYQTVCPEPPWHPDLHFHLLQPSCFTPTRPTRHSHKATQRNVQCKEVRVLLSVLRSGVMMRSSPGPRLIHLIHILIISQSLTLRKLERKGYKLLSNLSQSWVSLKFKIIHMIRKAVQHRSKEIISYCPIPHL